MDGDPPRRQLPGFLLAPCLIGLALGIYGTDACASLAANLHPAHDLSATLLIAMLAALWMGLRSPRLLRSLLSSNDVGDRERVLAADCDVGSASTRADHLRILNAGCLLVAGAAIMLLRPLDVLIGRSYAAALAQFHWTMLTLRLLEVCLVWGWVLIPLACLGMALNCSLRLAHLHSRRLATTLPAMCAGLSAGLAMAPPLLEWSASATSILVAVCLMAAAAFEVQPALPDRVSRATEEGVPLIEDRGRRVLMLALGATGMLVMLHLLAWCRLEPIVGLWRGGACLLAAVVFGLLAGAMPGERWIPAPLHLAGLAGLTAVSVVITVLAGDALFGLGELPRWLGVVTGLIILLPGFGAGVLLAALIESVAERRDRRAREALSASGGVLLGLLTAVFLEARLMNGLGPFGTFVFIAMGWLALAFVVMLMDPAFGWRPFVRSLAATFCLLLVWGWVLPWAQRPWRRANAVFAARTQATVLILDDFADAQALIDRVAAGRGWPRGEGEQRVPIDALWRRLSLMREPCAAVSLMLSEPAGGGPPLAIVKAVIAQIHARLGPDGVLVLSIDRRGEPARGEVNRFAHLVNLFAEREWVDGARWSTCVAYRRPGSAFSSPPVVAQLSERLPD